MFNFIFSILPDFFLRLKQSLHQLVTFLFMRKEAQIEVTNALLQEEILKNREVIRKLIHIKRKEAEIAAQPSPTDDDVNDVDQWMPNDSDHD